VNYLLDANAVIAIMRRNHRFGERMRSHPQEDLGTSAIALFELYYGMFRSQRVQENLRALRAVDIPIVAFEREDADKAGEIRARLGAAGTTIGPYDTMIAGQALARDLILVTHNMREFARVEGLRLEDWEA
jgi:tRNA(fMet)-specific endonuclease VapC